MKYRKLAPNSDYTFGAGNSEFYIDIEAVAQAIKTRLQLFKATFWRDLNDGTPWLQEILGARASEQHLLTVDSIIQNRIAGTTGVLGIVDYNRTYDRDTRRYSYTTTVQTIYSTTVISGVL